MNDLINLLQTITLLVGLLLSVIVLFLIVYTLGRFVTAFQTLLQAIDRIGHASAPAPVAAPVSEPEPIDEEPGQAPLPDEQYHCGTCAAKLPKIPKHSVIKDEISVLVFKCRRCGKDTEVDPAKGQPK